MKTAEYKNEIARLSVDLATAKANAERYYASYKRALDTCAEDYNRVFMRHDVEHMTRQQLVSLIEQGINEARRKGMVEAEGLLQKHLDNANNTDIEMMEGVIREYTKRVDELKAKQVKKPPVQLDKLPLSDKLDAIKTVWWKAGSGPSGYASFDKRASEVEKLAKEKVASTAPKELLDGKPVVVKGQHGGSYIVQRKGKQVSCTCPSWFWNDDVDVERRTCKHLKDYLGEAAELARISAPQAPKPVAQASCWCGVVLVRGQCQIHTNQWKGDERCNCGRLFSFCKDEFNLGKAPTRSWHEPRLQGTPEPQRTSEYRCTRGF